MLNVDFENLLYLSPVIAVYPDKAIVRINDNNNDFKRVFDMCEVERDFSIEIIIRNNITIIPLKTKG